MTDPVTHMLLTRLRARPGRTPSRLAADLRLNVGAVTRLLHLLERAGRVRHTPTPQPNGTTARHYEVTP